MSVRSTWLLAPLVFCMSWVPARAPLEAAPEVLDAGTILLVSIDDVSAFKQDLATNQLGLFLRDPEMAHFMTELRKGLAGLIQARLPAGEDGATDREVAKVIEEYASCLFEHATGRILIAGGLHTGDDGKLRPDLIVHLQGGECFGSLHQRMFDAFKRRDSDMATATLELEGIVFRGVIAPAMEEDGLHTPDGVFFGSQGTDHYIGLNKKSLGDLLRARREVTTGAAGAGQDPDAKPDSKPKSGPATGPESGPESGPDSGPDSGTGAAVEKKRLSDEPFYQRALARLGPGRTSLFLNLAPLWRSLERIELDPQTVQLLASSGLLGMNGVGMRWNLAAAGSGLSIFMDLPERRGLGRILPVENVRLEFPREVPPGVLSATLVRLELDSVLEVIGDFLEVTQGEGARRGITDFLSMASSQAGFPIQPLIENLEGSVVVLSHPSGAVPTEAEQFLVAMDQGRYSYLVRLEDPALVTNALQSLAQLEFAQQFVRVEDFLGKRLYVVDFTGGESSSLPTPGIVVDGQWLMLSFLHEDLRELLRTGAATEESARLSGASDYRALAGRFDTNGMALWYENRGKTVSELVEAMRNLLQDLGEDVDDFDDDDDFDTDEDGGGSDPDDADGEDQIYDLLRTLPLPSSAMIEKYFGRALMVIRIAEDGSLFGQEWSPNPLYREPSPVPSEGTKPAEKPPE